MIRWVSVGTGYGTPHQLGQQHADGLDLMKGGLPYQVVGPGESSFKKRSRKMQVPLPQDSRSLLAMCRVNHMNRTMTS